MEVLLSFLSPASDGSGENSYTLMFTSYGEEELRCIS